LHQIEIGHIVKTFFQIYPCPVAKGGKVGDEDILRCPEEFIQRFTTSFPNEIM
jgi:hypothetical protein